MHGTPGRPSASGVAARRLESGPCLFLRFPAMALTHGALSEEEASLGPDMEQRHAVRSQNLQALKRA